MSNTHLSYRTSNPALNSNTFKNPVDNNSLFLDKTMTIQGTVDKTAIALVLLIISAYYTFSSGMESMICKIPIVPRKKLPVCIEIQKYTNRTENTTIEKS